jgi:hypothetical protein
MRSQNCSLSPAVRMSKWLSRILLLLLVGSMSACATGRTMSWKEEVLLHDGSKIIAERHYNLGGYPGLESHNRMSLDETVTFNLPDHEVIVWKNDFRDSVPEPNSLNHFRFDIVDGKPYLATYPAGCIAYNKWGRPNPPQILFKYENAQWQRITLAELPSVLAGTSANVIVGKPDQRILKPFYSAEGVDAQNHNISTPEYKTILREAVANAGRRCGEMVYDGRGGWIGMGWFREQKSKEACLKYCAMEKVPAQYCPCNELF